MFSKRIEIENESKNFNFYPIAFGPVKKYRVEVNDKDQIYIFRMLLDKDEQWKIEGADLPLWIQKSEYLLSETIIENLFD